MMRDIVWITEHVALLVHVEQLRRHGGDEGTLNPGMVKSALARPRTILGYLPATSLEELAAALAMGFAKGHPFVDGNKRTASVLSLMFLRLNAVEIITSEKGLGDVFIAAADGTLDQEGLANWFVENSTTTD